MKAPSLQKTAAMSAFLHLTIFLLAAVVLKQSNHVNLPSPYIVDLVSPSATRSVTRTHHASRHIPRKSSHPAKAMPARRQVKKRKRKEMIKEKRRERVQERMAEKSIEDRIAQLAAIEKIKKIYKLRQVISVPATGQESATTQSSQSRADNGAAGQKTMGSYMDRITGEIWKQWNWDPSMGEKSLEAVVAVLISKDGTITVQKIEKPSGNRFFDLSALRALKDASPVTPPPDASEIEIGIRFFL